MSGIYFHTENDGEARLQGAERAMMGTMCADVAMIGFGSLFSMSDGERPHWLARYLDPSVYAFRDTRWDQRAVATHLRLGHSKLRWGGTEKHLIPEREEDLFTIHLNSALAMESECLYLAARLHGQCEIHCYIEPDDFEWVAWVIRGGLDRRIFRQGVHWEDVLRLLDEASGPIVCSYSVTDSFPGWDCEKGEPRTFVEHLAELRAEPMLRIQKEGWRGFRYGSGLTSWQMRAEHEWDHHARPEVSQTDAPPIGGDDE